MSKKRDEIFAGLFFGIFIGVLLYAWGGSLPTLLRAILSGIAGLILIYLTQSRIQWQTFKYQEKQFLQKTYLEITNDLIKIKGLQDKKDIISELENIKLKLILVSKGDALFKLEELLESDIDSVELAQKFEDVIFLMKIESSVNNFSKSAAFQDMNNALEADKG